MMRRLDAAAVTPAATAVASGLVVMAMIYTIGPLSGAHMNPVVSLAFALRRVFLARHVPLRVVAIS
jgi:glycerol uptake facilitator-like aquaporin